MFAKNSMRNKIILSIIIGCLIPYIVGGIYLTKYVDKWLYEDNLQNTNRFLRQVDEFIDQALIGRFSEAVSMLAESNMVYEADSSIRSYRDFTSVSLLPGPSSSEISISKAFAEVKRSHKDINYIFLGLEDGSYIEYPEFMPKSAYDPTTRPWYKNSINTNEIVISDPYISQVTKDMIVSFTRKVKLKDGRNGVVGLSVKIDALTRSIDSIRLGDSGYILILNTNDRITVSPENPGWLLRTPEELKLNFLQNIENRTGQAFEAKIDGEEKLIGALISRKSGWKLFAIQPKRDVVGKSRSVSSILVAIYFVMMTVVSLIVYFILQQITRPILGISKAINRIAAYDFNFCQNTDMSRYAMRNDEIGTITKALGNMQDSFAELNNTIESMDTAIKNIDFTKDAPKKLILSTDSPFSHVATSFNRLLEHIQEYLSQLKASNQEIHEKNKELKEKEEKLVAHIEEIDKQKQYINFLAYHDPLTNLPNRRKFIECLDSAIAGNKIGAVVYLDIDNFKRINETMGHVYGDKVLMGITSRLEALAAKDIFISRFSGDEFLILVESEDDLENVRKFIAGLLKIFDGPVFIEGNNVEVSFSIGVSLFPYDSTDSDQLIMNADTALYEVKRTGKNGYKFFDISMTEHLMRKAGIELQIRDAIENDGFRVLYQPQIKLENGEIVAYEALIRLKNNSATPAEFIPVAEDNGSIIKIGRIVTQKVIEQLSSWQLKGYPLRAVSINFSAIQLYDIEYLDFLLKTLSKYNVAAKFIEMEITESIFLDNKELALEFLKRLRDQGIKTSIDDFGTGYSSLSYLTFLPLDKIKLDRSLNVKFLEFENIKVMDSIISLAHSLDLEVVAEGIETSEQFRRLRDGHCDYIQGYYFSRPLEADVVEANYNVNYYTDKDS